MKRHDDTTIRSYPVGHRLDVAGGSAAIIPPIDFETYSTAGIEFENGRWISALGKGKQKRGIKLVGAFAYAEHASTEILSLAYDLHDGEGERIWLPGLPYPADLFDYLGRGGHVEAHNALFEFAIWVNVAVKKLGWPWLPLDQLHDSAAKCSAHNIPRALAKAAAVMGTMPKQADGDRMIKLFSVPRNPTKSDQRLRLDPQTHPEGPRLYTYNRDDIRAERELSANLPDLSDFEKRVFECDKAINVRGVQIDLEAVHGARRIIAAASDRYTRELLHLTGGQVDAATKVAQMSGWLAGRGFPVPNLDADVVDGLLKRPDLPGDVSKVLKIRAEMGSTSVSKIETIHHTVSHDGRLRGLYVYGGASQTLRWSGSGAQPQNLPGDGPPMVRCGSCGAYSAPVFAGACYRCEGVNDPSGAKWTPEAADHFIDLMKVGDLTELLQYTGEPLQTISGCLRGLFTAAPGCELIGADYSAIEAVVLACLAGEHWRIEVFKTHGKIYEMSAAQITGISFDEMMAHKERTGDHHPARKTIGKVAELACFAPDTQVLTKNGYKPIIKVNSNDQLWDGTQWVQSDGAIYKGLRETIHLDGVTLTKNHPIYIGPSWKPAKALASNLNTLNRALAIASANLPFSSTLSRKKRGVLSLFVHAVMGLTSSLIQTFTKGKLPVAENAGGPRQKRLTSSCTRNTRTYCPTRNTAAGWLIGSGRLLRGATDLTPGVMKTTAGEGSGCVNNGAEKTARRSFLNTLLPYLIGTFQATKWTGLKRIKVMRREILGSLVGDQIIKTDAAYRNCSGNSTTSGPVYDIVNAGPLNRFTIKTQSGHLIVHNSGYQGGLGAWKNFGADRFMSDDEIKTAVKAWRQANPAIVALWYGLENSAIEAVKYPGYWFTYGRISYLCADGVLFCHLPSGRLLKYHSPRLMPDFTPWGAKVEKLVYWGVDGLTKQWVEKSTYGGHLTENVCQAVARDIQANGMINAEAAGLPVVLHTHDELTAETPIGRFSGSDLSACMNALPDWCADWPIKAPPGWVGQRYRKD